MASRWTAKADRDLDLAAQIVATFPEMAAYHFQLDQRHQKKGGQTQAASNV